VAGPDESSGPDVGAAASGVADASVLAVPPPVGLADPLADAVALGVADAVAFVVVVGSPGAVVAPDPDDVVEPAALPDPDVEVPDVVVAGFEVGSGAAVVALGLVVVGAGLLVAGGEGGAMPGWPPEPNAKPTTLPGAGS
jgi:hypothetical protein